MQIKDRNILDCIDILSVALVIGLAVRDAPRSRSSEGGEGSDSGEEITEDEAAEDEEAEVGSDESQDEAEKANSKLEQAIEKMWFPSKPSVTPAPSPNSPSTPSPGGPPAFVPSSEGGGEASAANSKGEDNEPEIMEGIKDYEYASTLRGMATGNSPNLSRKGKMMKVKLTDGEKERGKDVADDGGAVECDLQALVMGGRAKHHDVDPSKKNIMSKKKGRPNSLKSSGPKFDKRANYLPRQSSPVRVLTVLGDSSNKVRDSEHPKDGGVTEAEFVQHVEDSLVQAHAFTRNDTSMGLHSQRELEMAAAIRDSPHSNRPRETEHGADEGVTEAEFVQHVRDSLVEVPAILAQYYGKNGPSLHSNSERELETAAALTDASISTSINPQPAAAPEPPRSAKQGQDSNTVREVLGVVASRKAHLHVVFDEPPLHSTSNQTEHSNTEREFVAGGTETNIESRGPVAETASPQPPSWGDEIHSKTELAARAGTSSSDSSFQAGSATVLPSNREREPAIESKRAANLREPFKRSPSQRSLIGASFEAVLNLNPTHYTGTTSKSAEAQAAQKKPEKILSERELVGLRYVRQKNSYPGIRSSKGADSSNGIRPPPGGQKRKMSQNDLLGLAYARVRDTGAANGAGPSDAPQPSPPPHKDEIPEPPFASQIPLIPSPDTHSDPSRPAQTDSATQMDIEPSSDAQTAFTAPVNEVLDSRYNSQGHSSDSGQHRYPEQRDLNNSRRYHPYEQPQAWSSAQAERASNEGGAGERSGYSVPFFETPSGFFPRMWSGGSRAPYPDPNPDSDDDGDGEGESIPEDDRDNDPHPPALADEDEYNNPQPIPVEQIDRYPPPPPPDEEVIHNPQPISDIDYYGNNHTLEYQYQHLRFPYPPVPPPMLPGPWNPPTGNYFTSYQIDRSRLTFLEAPHDHVQHPVERPYLRVRHPSDRMLSRRPRCGLLIVTAMREDKSLPVDRRKGDRIPRTPGSVDVHFIPRMGDVILRHVRLPGQGAVEIWHPSLQTQDGDSLVRFKLDPFSYDRDARDASNLLIVTAKGYIYFEDMWIYLGRATHSITKAQQRVYGIGAIGGRTVYGR